MTDEARAILEKLPEVLRQTPELRHGIFEIIAERFPPREEMARVLEEIRDLREEASRRFEAMDRRFEAMDRRFEAMDRRFEAMDRHFDDVYALLRDVGHKTDVVVGGFTR
ncbi:MAG: hypothetical protein HY722_06900, partial [Planctomycetes bacterium]|nr:hypothetical protein [Planctomycetota bacterium]